MVREEKLIDQKVTYSIFRMANSILLKMYRQE